MIRIFSLFSFLIVLLSLQYGYGQTMPTKKTNVILILTDDQGIGDIGYLNNPFVKTPNLDELAKESVVLSNFYVSPVCAPTRASLLTGRYSIRTGVHDTWNGGSMMATEERTMAEYFKEMNYNTAIFGKWHLGDNYPFRASDQGFTTSLVLKSGGLGQIGDVDNYLKKDSSYFDPVLYRNNEPYKSKGYCSDVYTNAAINYVAENKAKPFFMYLAYNAPHVPLQVPKKYYDMYADLDTRIKASGNKDFLDDNIGLTNLEQTKRVYAMMSNIDDNIGRLIQALKDQNILDNTIIVFMSDNGPQQNRFKGGYKGIKSNVYEGGIKVPAFIYAPKLFTPRTISETLSHIDMLPTLLELDKYPKKMQNLDGRSFAPLLNGKKDESFNSRPLFFFWQRGFPEPYRNVAVRKGDYKLVGNTGPASAASDFELYNVKSDPGELHNLSQNNTAIVNDLKNDFDNWYKEAIRSSHLKLSAQRIILGSPMETKSTLNRNDAKGIPVNEQDNTYFYWDVRVQESGNYNFEVNFLKPVHAKGKLYIRLAPFQRTENNAADLAGKLSSKKMHLDKGDYVLEAWYEEATGQSVFPFYVEVEKD